jgi:hypothetical protein
MASPDVAARSLVHPATAAWARVGGTAPRAVELLKASKSVVYRLAGAGARGEDVVAKRGRWSGIERERTMYAEILPGRVPVPPLYGTVRDGPDHGWLFVGDAGPETSLDRPALVAVARFAAALHRLPLAGLRLPLRDMGTYAAHLRSAQAALRAAAGAPGFPSEATRVLSRLADRLKETGEVWDSLERRAAEVEPAVVHGDLFAKNVRIGPDGRCRAFDWENAGIGCPAIDIAVLAGCPAALDAYGSLPAGQASLGTVLWLVTVVDREGPGLAHPPAERLVRKLGAYDELLAGAMESV